MPPAVGEDAQGSQAAGRREGRGDSQRPRGVLPRAYFFPAGEWLAARAPRHLPDELLHARAHRPEECRRGGGAGTGAGRPGKAAGAQVARARRPGPYLQDLSRWFGVRCWWYRDRFFANRKVELETHAGSLSGL